MEPADLRAIGEFGVRRRIDIAHHGIATHPPG
ncbi:hypothetical protein Y590_01720 [Methylobacterium sp. AMS5]|nr:hypothetical protein Y590_01720 [Methylobacterium sp. AMS5]